MLRDVTFPCPISEMIAQNHERLDGSGYPEGLSGDATGIDARIIAVADVFESMSTHRPYRSALGPGAALAEIARGRGTKFNPAVVDACRTIVNKVAQDLPELWRLVERAGTTSAARCADGVSAYDGARD